MPKSTKQTNKSFSVPFQREYSNKDIMITLNISKTLDFLQGTFIPNLFRIRFGSSFQRRDWFKWFSRSFIVIVYAITKYTTDIQTYETILSIARKQTVPVYLNRLINLLPKEGYFRLDYIVFRLQLSAEDVKIAEDYMDEFSGNLRDLVELFENNMIACEPFQHNPITLTLNSFHVERQVQNKVMVQSNPEEIDPKKEILYKQVTETTISDSIYTTTRFETSTNGYVFFLVFFPSIDDNDFIATRGILDIKYKHILGSELVLLDLDPIFRQFVGDYLTIQSKNPKDTKKSQGSETSKGIDTATDKRALDNQVNFANMQDLVQHSVLAVFNNLRQQGLDLVLRSNQSGQQNKSKNIDSVDMNQNPEFNLGFSST